MTTTNSDLPRGSHRNPTDNDWYYKSLADICTRTRLSPNRRPPHFDSLGCRAPDTHTKRKTEVLAFYHFMSVRIIGRQVCLRHLLAWYRCDICECPWKRLSDCSRRSRVRCYGFVSGRHIDSPPIHLYRYPCWWILVPFNERRQKKTIKSVRM